MELWVEKYRPTKIEDFINLPPEMKDILEGETIPPHLLLSSIVPGIGKTTLQRMIVKKFADSSIEINASDERGIDVIRNKVKFFSMKKGNNFLAMEEADGLTNEAQQSLRRLMELYKNTRFVFTCNYLYKIIEPLRSRCNVIEFTNPKPKDILARLEYICKNEKIEYEIEDIEKIISLTYPDVRSAINTMQGKIVKNRIELGSVVATEDVSNAAYKLIKEKKYKLLRKLLKNYTVDYNQLYEKIFDKVFENDTIDEYDKKKCLVMIAERMYKNNFVSNPFINFVAGCVEIEELI